MCPITSCSLATASSGCIDGLGVDPDIKLAKMMIDGMPAGFKLQYKATDAGFKQSVCMKCKNVAGDEETVTFNDITQTSKCWTSLTVKQPFIDETGIFVNPDMNATYAYNST